MTASARNDQSSVPAQAGPVRARPRFAAAVALAPLVALLAACGSGVPAAQAGGPTSSPSRSGQSGSNGQGGGGANFPGATGLIAAVSAGMLQVQGPDAQTTVTYTKATRFTQTVTAKVAAGDCVMVTGTPVTGSSTALTATSVRVQAKVNGACPANGRGPGFGGPSFGGQGGSGQGFNGSARPSGSPRSSGAPSGPQGLRAFAVATGTVGTVSGSTVTVLGVLREARSVASAAASPAVTTITVTLASTTTVTQTVLTTSAAAVVGRCATALGKADDRGDIAAMSIAISTPGPTGCRAGFGGFGRGGFGGNGTGGNGTGGASGSGSGTNA